MNYDEILNKLKDKKPFQFVRVGDGEMFCMDGKQGKNTDGHKYFTKLGSMLRQIYSKPLPYVVGLQPVKHGLHSNAEKYPQKWVNADVLHDASIEDRISELYNVLKERNVVIVGNRIHKKLPFINYCIEVPTINAFQYMEQAWKVIAQIAIAEKDTVFLFSCGMMKGVLIDRLYRLNPNQTALDTGSVFEPYLGKSIRRYHKKILERENSKHSDLQKES